MSARIPLFAAEPALEPAARRLAAEWGLPHGQGSRPETFLLLSASRLQLLQSGSGPVSVEFVEGAAAHRRRYGGGRGQALARAVGLKGGRSPGVLDATAGFGADAFVLASLGCHVLMVERSPVVAALLADGLRRAAEDAEIGAMVRDRLALRFGEAGEVMAGLAPGERPDVVYLDPMFPGRTKSAQVKKGMQALHRILTPDPHPEALLGSALAVARERVVVKRPAAAEPLAGYPPTLAIATRKHRFDVYVIAALRR